MFDLERPEHAYLLGFLMGDGCLTQGRGAKGNLSVELHVRDKVLLEQLVPLLPGSRLTERTRRTNFSKGDYTTAVLSCSGREVREALMRVGLPVGRKDTVITPPAELFSERDFARGLVDADGSVGWTSPGQPFVSLVTSSPRMAEWWCGVLLERAGARRSAHPNTRDGVYNLLVIGEPSVALSGWLYADGDLALERKAAKAREQRTWVRPEGMRSRSSPRRWTDEEDDVLRHGGLSQKELAERLGRTVQSVNLRAWRLRQAAQGLRGSSP